MRKKQRLKILLKILISLFIIFGAAAILLAGIRKTRIEARQKQEAMEALKNVPTAAPTVSVTPSPSPTPRPTATPTPVPTVVAAFDPNDFWDYWYSTDGTATINVYDISLDKISFSFYQTDRNQSQSVSADVTAEVAGNAARFDFNDSAGNRAAGNIIFDKGQLYVRIATGDPVSSVYPNVNCIMSRDQVYLEPDPSSDQLELAKNEIYARHGRQFVTQYISDYFNSKSWYQGTIDPDTFDAQQDSIFNEYEMANISKIAEWEERKSGEGN